MVHPVYVPLKNTRVTRLIREILGSIRFYPLAGCRPALVGIFFYITEKKLWFWIICHTKPDMLVCFGDDSANTFAIKHHQQISKTRFCFTQFLRKNPIHQRLQNQSFLNLKKRTKKTDKFCVSLQQKPSKSPWLPWLPGSVPPTPRGLVASPCTTAS